MRSSDIVFDSLKIYYPWGMVRDLHSSINRRKTWFFELLTSRTNNNVHISCNCLLKEFKDRFVKCLWEIEICFLRSSQISDTTHTSIVILYVIPCSYSWQDVIFHGCCNQALIVQSVPFSPYLILHEITNAAQRIMTWPCHESFTFSQCLRTIRFNSSHVTAFKEIAIIPQVLIGCISRVHSGSDLTFDEGTQKLSIVPNISRVCIFRG